MSLEKDILEYLVKNKNTIKYKGMHVGFLGLPDFEHYKYQTLANKSSYLKRLGYIKEVSGNCFITRKGEQFLEEGTRGFFKKFTTEKINKDPKDLLIIYDIPQNQTSARNWFRRELIAFHFIMIQRSVWVGPSPLPKDFVEYIKELKINENFKTFQLAKGYDFKK